MKKQVFPAQPFYAGLIETGEVIDTRFISQAVNVPEDQIEYAFDAPQPTLPLEDFDKDQRPTRRRLIQGHGFINGLVQVNYAGRDGEDYSGYVHQLEVNRPGNAPVGVIRSWNFAHKNGLPSPDTSWVCEFAEPAQADIFWRHYWSPDFSIDSLSEAISVFEKDYEEADTQVYELGLFRPWYEQRTSDALILDRFASAGPHVLARGKKDKPAENFAPGHVFKVPETHAFTSKIKKYHVATCVGSLAFSQYDWMTGRTMESVGIQWENGAFRQYRADQPELLPQPLKTHMVTAQKQTA